MSQFLQTHAVNVLYEVLARWKYIVVFQYVLHHVDFHLSGLLYYAGHGYENYGNSFMVPIDAPNPYRSANCLCVQNILKLMQEKETGLNVFLLDMCRKR